MFEDPHEFDATIPTPCAEQLLLHVVPIDREDLPRMLMPFPYRKVLQRVHTISSKDTPQDLLRTYIQHDIPQAHAPIPRGRHELILMQFRPRNIVQSVLRVEPRPPKLPSALFLDDLIHPRHARRAHTFSTFIPPCPPGPFTPSRLSRPLPTSPKFADPVERVGREQVDLERREGGRAYLLLRSCWGRTARRRESTRRSCRGRGSDAVRGGDGRRSLD